MRSHYSNWQVHSKCNDYLCSVFVKLSYISFHAICENFMLYEDNLPSLITFCVLDIYYIVNPLILRQLSSSNLRLQSVVSKLINFYLIARRTNSNCSNKLKYTNQLFKKMKKIVFSEIFSLTLLSKNLTYNDLQLNSCSFRNIGLKFSCQTLLWQSIILESQDVTFIQTWQLFWGGWKAYKSSKQRSKFPVCDIIDNEALLPTIIWHLIFEKHYPRKPSGDSTDTSQRVYWKFANLSSGTRKGFFVWKTIPHALWS